MVEERELACDEEVLRMGCGPADYVGGILKVCASTGVAITVRFRSDGRGCQKASPCDPCRKHCKRVDQRKKDDSGGDRPGGSRGACLIGVLNAPAQERAARVEFEVASVKPGDPLDPESSVRSTAAGIFMKNTTLKNLLQNAYHIRSDQIEGGPKWMDSVAVHNLTRNCPQACRATSLPQALQSLLEDRFKLQVHRESRIRPVFALVQAKGGSKLHIAAPDEPGRGGFSAGPRKLQGRGVSISTLVYALASAAGRALNPPIRTSRRIRFHLGICTSPGYRR